MDPAAQVSLSALRDIHLPAAVSIWPLAPGVWLLGTALLLLGAAAAVFVRARRGRPRSWSELAAEELTRIEAAFSVRRDVVGLATALSSLLRRSVLARFPQKQAASLHGDAWFELLCRDEQTPDDDDSVQSRSLVVRELTETAYAGTRTTVDPDAWIAFVRSWIGAAA